MALLRRVVAVAKGNAAHANLPTGRRVVPFYGCGCAIIGRNGVEEIIDVQLNDTEKAAFAKSAEAVRAMNADLKSVL